MNTLNKIAMVACATFLTTAAAGFATEYRLVRVDHGRGISYAMRPVEGSATIAVLSHGQSVGQSVGQSATMHTHDTDRQRLLMNMGRGQTMYVRAR